MLRRLEFALAIDTHRSFHRAARAMNISQPSLTRALQVLEKEFGARLFERGKAECEPTEFGRVVLAHARRIVAEIAEAKRSIAFLKDLETGELRVGAASFVTQVWLGKAVGEVSAAHPKLRIRNVEYPHEQLPDALLTGEIDVAIGESTVTAAHHDIVVSRLPRRRGVMICRAGHPLAALQTVAVKDLARFPLAGPTLPLRIAVHLPAKSALGEIDARSKLFIPSILSTASAGIGDVVEGSDALGIVPLVMFANMQKHRALVALPFTAPWLVTEQALRWRSDRMVHPALMDFREAARRAEAATMGGKSKGRSGA